LRVSAFVVSHFSTHIFLFDKTVYDDIVVELDHTRLFLLKSKCVRGYGRMHIWYAMNLGWMKEDTAQTPYIHTQCISYLKGLKSESEKKWWTKKFLRVERNDVKHKIFCRILQFEGGYRSMVKKNLKFEFFIEF